MNVKHTFSNLSILYKMLILYIVILTSCICVLTGIIAVNSTNTIREIAYNSASQVMASTYRSMLSQVKDVNYMFTTLQANRSLQAALKDKNPDNAAYNVALLDDILFGIDVYGKKVSNIELYAIGHPEYASCDTEHIFPDRAIMNTKIYDDIISGGTEPIWLANDNNYSTHSFITAFKVLTESYTDTPLGIIRIDIDTSQFVAPLKNLRFADTGQIFLCTSAAHIINPYNDEFIAGFSHNRDLYSLIQKNEMCTIYTSINSVSYMLTSYPLDSTGFYLVGAAKLSDFKANALPLRNAIFLTAIIMSLVILLLLYYVSSYISKPIIRLANSIDRYNSDKPCVIAYDRNDEIGRLYSSFNDMQTRISNLISDLSDSLTIQKKTELKAIQSQISPHFLYNTLNSISAMAQKHNIEEIEYMTSSLATFFMRTLNNGNTFCTINDELTHIQSYVDIQNIRFSNKFNMLIDVSEDIRKCSIINLTLQPLVENCIVHAFRGKAGIGTISINARRSGDDIYIDVADDGLGANTVDVGYLNKYVDKPFNFDEQIEQYGIHNVNHRIKLYYGDEYGLSYSYNDMGGITATVHICVNQKEDIII